MRAFAWYDGDIEANHHIRMEQNTQRVIKFRAWDGKVMFEPS
jgi:hypothetical protein